jgi:hypothetical protein
MLEMIGIYGEMRSYVKFSLQKCLVTFRTILKDLNYINLMTSLISFISMLITK